MKKDLLVSLKQDHKQWGISETTINQVFHVVGDERGSGARALHKAYLSVVGP